MVSMAYKSPSEAGMANSVIFPWLEPEKKKIFWKLTNLFLGKQLW